MAQSIDITLLVSALSSLSSGQAGGKLMDQAKTISGAIDKVKEVIGSITFNNDKSVDSTPNPFSNGDSVFFYGLNGKSFQLKSETDRKYEKNNSKDDEWDEEKEQWENSPELYNK